MLEQLFTIAEGLLAEPLYIKVVTAPVQLIEGGSAFTKNGSITPNKIYSILFFKIW